LLNEAILNLQITILLTLGTIIFICVSFKRRDLIPYLPTYILTPIGYFLIYLQVFNYTYRLLGNIIFLIAVLLFIFAVYYEYFKAIKKNHNTTANNPKNGKAILSLSPITSLIIGIQLFFSVLIVIAIIMLIKLYFMKRSTKYASLIVFLASALLSAIATILSYFQLPGIWEFSFVAMIILSAVYFMFPIMVYLEEKLAKVGGKLRESEEKYKLISENANDLMAILNDKYEYEYINEQVYQKYLGYSRNHLIGKNVWELVHPEDVERIMSSQQLSINGFQADAGEDIAELRIKHKNGKYIWMEYTGKVFINPEGKPNVIVITRDITERKKAEQKLRESEEKFRTITEQSFIGVLIEQDFDILYVNQQFSTIIGYNIEELLNWKLPDFYDILHHEDVDKFKELIDKKTKGLTDKITNFQSRLFKKTGEVIWIEIFSREFMYQDRPANLAFVMDITDLKEAEEVIRKENKKLLELDNLRKELITRISHELRTPLTSIYGASQILLQSNKKDVIEKIWPYLEINYRGSIRLKGLIDNLLDASRLDNKKFELRLSNENLNSLINDCIKELHYLADKRHLTINAELPVAVYFKLDKHRFEQVFVNILSNAIKNTPPHGQIFVILNETPDQIDVIIKDTGVGLTKDEKTKIFQKFGKIERYGMDLDVDIEGAGLGLYISKEIVKLHRGEILVESEGRNKGCTFIVRLYKLLDKLKQPDQMQNMVKL